MAKYSYEFKMKVVQEYLAGKGGFAFLSEKYNISSTRDLQKWVSAYNQFGSDGLMRKRKNQTYSFEFKLHVVELYLTTEVSYQDLALSVGINNPPLISKWVNDYRIAGLDALKPKQKGRRPKVDKPKDTNLDKSKKINVETEYLKQLEDENLKLRIENAYLKELRRLRLEGTPQNKKRESSTASEDPSN
ncbi:helix-turn-helix domain-containing protein [Tissierella carlieri]|uniref:helix-turn-helix domain-containing protein n=2 Tax=Tissierella carlieri TaxID=689904 RepID=UPI001FE3C8AA|nr:helix-turn-helix domain-containing protein [Tissierella carlieri]